MGSLISVIVPIYRVEKYLEKCISSIVNQTYKNLEIILVDDGSDDGCPRICDEFAARDKRIVVIHKKNEGQSLARKDGIRIAKGDYIGYVDGDDWIEPNMYEALYSILIASKVDIVESGVIDSTEHSYSNRAPNIPPGVYKGENFEVSIEPYCLYSGDFFSYGIYPYLVSKLFKRESILEFQQADDPSDNIGDDVFCAIPAVLKSKSIAITEECFYHYRIREDSTKRRKRESIIDTIKNCYPIWKNRLLSVSDERIIKQLDVFILYLLVAKSIQSFDENTEEYFVPFGGIPAKSKVVLYGAGMVGEYFYRYINNIDLELVFWVDRNYEDLGKYLPVEAPTRIKDIDFDFIVISALVKNAHLSIKEDLKKLKVPEEKILWIEEEYIKNPKKLLSELKVVDN